MNRIEVDPQVLGGKAVIRGTRIPVYLILELLGNGLSESDVISQYPPLEIADIKAALIYASKCV